MTPSASSRDAEALRADWCEAVHHLAGAPSMCTTSPRSSAVQLADVRGEIGPPHTAFPMEAAR